MANAPALWSHDGSMSWGPRSAGTSEVPLPPLPSVRSQRVDDLDPSTVQSRCEPTTLRPKATTSFRRGAEPPQKSSLPFFVLVGLVVGLFAFMMMQFCLPDPMEQMAAREARAARTFPPAPPIPVQAPIQATPMAEVLPAQATVTTIAPADPVRVATTKTRVRRETRVKKKAAGQLPSNPYAN